ncbi:hypothetical protein [Nonomuraea sp. NPDC049480]|uniref:hypothetical protein n=1 Tax=Nonomuraea sp. NPDC049480 TaxID=3364353 RepID=UPI0037ACFF93
MSVRAGDFAGHASLNRTCELGLTRAADRLSRVRSNSSVSIRRGHGYSVRITALLALHRAALELSAALADAGPTERKAHRVYAARVTAVQATRPHPS